MNNYHTHTYRCRHASGDVADYVAQAARAGLSELGFSDHCPHPDERWPMTHMSMEDLPSYIQALNEAKALAASGIAAGKATPRILSGLECEWVPEYLGFMKDEFLGNHGLDYLIAGIHSYPYQGGWGDTYAIGSVSELVAFTEASCKAMECGLFRFLAHPDVYCHSWLEWEENAISAARDIIATSLRTGVPLEINGYGMRKALVNDPAGKRRPYPKEEFWKMAAESGVVCVVSSDAHRPQDTAANLEDGMALAGRLGLKVLEGLPELKG
jgi:histidinol-phosphatase (PHP family)